MSRRDWVSLLPSSLPGPRWGRGGGSQPGLPWGREPAQLRHRAAPPTRHDHREILVLRARTHSSDFVFSSELGWEEGCCDLHPPKDLDDRQALQTAFSRYHLVLLHVGISFVLNRKLGLESGFWHLLAGWPGDTSKSLGSHSKVRIKIPSTEVLLRIQ